MSHNDTKYGDLARNLRKVLEASTARQRSYLSLHDRSTGVSCSQPEFAYGFANVRVTLGCKQRVWSAAVRCRPKIRHPALVLLSACGHCEGVMPSTGPVQ